MNEVDVSQATAATEESFRIPWTGNSFGITDLNFLTASVKPILIGITGVASAGKTSFLASLYCLLRHGRKIGDYRQILFAPEEKKSSEEVYFVPSAPAPLSSSSGPL